jgi:osmotically-inducible protein OsmY
MSKTPVYLIFVVILAFASFVCCSHSRTDAEITSEVQKEINSDSSIGTKQVSVVVNDGVVSLSAMVGSDFERNAASKDASQVQGVKRVLNNLQLASEAGNVPTQD